MFVVQRLHEEMSKQQQKFRIGELFQYEIFKPFILSLLSMVFQQFTGLFVLLFYTQVSGRMGHLFLCNTSYTITSHVIFLQTIFDMVGLADSKGATAIMGAVMIIAYFLTPLMVERTGRRAMLVISAIGVLVCSAILGACFYIHDNATPVHSVNGTMSTTTTTMSPETAATDKTVAYVAVIATVGYMGSYSLGYGPLPWVLIAELIPLRARATVGGIAICVTWLLTFVVTKMFVPLSAVVGVAGCFWIFTCFSALSLAYVAFLLPETKGRTLEEIEFYFKEGHFPAKSPVKRVIRTAPVT